MLKFNPEYGNSQDFLGFLKLIGTIYKFKESNPELFYFDRDPVDALLSYYDGRRSLSLRAGYNCRYSCTLMTVFGWSCSLEGGPYWSNLNRNLESFSKYYREKEHLSFLQGSEEEDLRDLEDEVWGDTSESQEEYDEQEWISFVSALEEDHQNSPGEEPRTATTNDALLQHSLRVAREYTERRVNGVEWRVVGLDTSSRTSSE